MNQAGAMLQLLYLAIPMATLGILVKDWPLQNETALSNAVVGAASDSSSHFSYLRDSNGSIELFSSCNSACHKCFMDHFQACLAYCKKGCQEYCDEKLSKETCEAEDHEELWVAKIGSIFDVMSDPAGRLCQFNSPDGCPENGRAINRFHGEGTGHSKAMMKL
ncbi:unnamed protein product [Durusdinium trenchii]|uniref:Uncharacterized protein n=1 Tax=Durusdinium trenchii TaxID=1381693 RepID=A0ABP0PYC4_9DINO